MLPPLATPVDLAAALGAEFTSEETLRAEAVLRSASSAVRDEARRTWTDDNGVLTEVPETAFTITLDAARRAWENPQGLTSEQYPEYVWRGTDKVEPGVYLTEAEKKRLQRLRGASGLWVQQTTRCDPNAGGVFVDDQYGCDPILIADHY